MPKHVMDRRAADNRYLHKDFHSALNRGIIYLHRHFGDAAVRDYLREFARRWHAPLRRRLVAEGLGALRQYFETLYGAEGATMSCEQTADELVLRVEACPAVMHLRSRGEDVSPLFSETTRTVNEALCEDTAYVAELVAYEPQNGRSIQRFPQEVAVIGCTEFIPAYSELFRALHRLGGEAAVRGFWDYLSETFLTNLRDLVAEHGLRGCWLYWSHTLNEEAADFTMELDEDETVFRITMHRCPSKGRLLAASHFEPYKDYCLHCDILYRNILGPMGYEYDIDLSRCARAACVVTVRRRQG